MNLFIDNLKFEKIMVYVGTHGKLVVSPLALQLNGHSLIPGGRAINGLSVWYGQVIFVCVFLVPSCSP